MRRDDSTSPFDVEADEADDVTQQFWGTSRGWGSRQHLAFDDVAAADPSAGPRNDDHTGSLGAIRGGLRAFRPRRSVRSHQTGQVDRTRRHGAAPQPQAVASVARRAPAEASLGELATGWHDDDVGLDAARSVGPTTEPTTEPLVAVGRETGLVPLSPVRQSSYRAGSGAIDPLLARIGMLIVVGLLLVPIALALRPSSTSTPSDTLSAALSNVDAPDAASETPEIEPSLSQPPSSSPATDPADVVADRPDPTSPPTLRPSAVAAASSPADQTPASSTTASSDSVGDVAQIAGSSSGVATASEPAERLIPDCPTTYVAGAGDSWYRIADAADVTPNALLDENLATVDTVIMPGDEICLPAGATMPTQPTTTTVEPSTTQAPTTTAPTATTVPATTQPPSTTPPTSSEVQQIIRDVWPDELEERALEIAWRESNYIPTAYNGWCCYGLFQIYWSVHVSWLDEYDIYSSADLLDARKNATAAYALYQRAGGWGPWGG